MDKIKNNKINYAIDFITVINALSLFVFNQNVYELVEDEEEVKELIDLFINNKYFNIFVIQKIIKKYKKIIILMIIYVVIIHIILIWIIIKLKLKN